MCADRAPLRMMCVDGLCKQPVTRWEVAVMMRGEV